MNLGKFFSRIFPSKQVSAPRRYIPGVGGTPIDENTSMSVSAFHRGVIYISTQIAKLPWEVKDKFNDVQEGKVSNLLSLAASEEMNAFFWRLTMIQNAIIHGNGYSEIVRDGAGRPVAMYPLPTASVEPLRTESGKLVYRVRNGEGSGEVYLQPSDVFHLKNFHTKDGIIGQGLLAYAAESLGISRSADRMASGIFNNSGVPSGVLKIAGKLSDEAYMRLAESWKEQNAGRKAGGVALLEEGVTFEAINLDPDVLQFLESRKFGVIEIARFLGLPPTKLFDSASATYSNVENSNLEVATDTLDAWANNLEMEADVKLLNGRFGGRFTELDLYAVFRGDMTTRSNYFSKMMQSGAITPNQIRAREGLAPYKDGDRYYIATNNFSPADRIDEIVDAQVAGKSTPAPAEPKDVTPTEDPALTKAAIDFLTK